MASFLSRTLPFRVSLFFRSFSRSAPVQTTHIHPPPATPQRYVVPRNSNGNLPVYSDIRNNGTRYLVHIRGVDGQAHVLAQELRISLPPRAKVHVQHGKNIVITGVAQKNEVIEWLKARGF